VLVAGYWVIARTKLRLKDLYTPDGVYWFSGGWNWRALVATLVGAVLAVGGAYSADNSGPFPADGLIPFLKPLYDYNWVIGLVGAFVVFAALSLPATNKEESRERRPSRIDPAAVDG
jgi:NCS1 family nucleobase:cation symporter-1